MVLSSVGILRSVQVKFPEFFILVQKLLRENWAEKKVKNCETLLYHLIIKERKEQKGVRHFKSMNS